MSHPARPVRVRHLPGHPLVVSERHARRPSPMWDEPVPLFPDWLLADDIRRHFTVVDRRPDVTMVTLSYHNTETELERFRSLRDPDVPLVVFYTLDDFEEPDRGGWDRPPTWSEAVHRLTADADLLVGAQLPVSV